MLIALYRAVEQLYERTVGEKLIVTVETDEGKVTIQSCGATSPERNSGGTACQAF